MRNFAAFLLMMALAIAAVAHGGSKHIKGTVKEIKGDTITVQTTENETVTVSFDAQTKFQKSGAAADAKQLKAGERVVIDIPEEGKAKATMIQFGALPKAEAHTGHNEAHR
ncbi:MAG TPA: myosin N-terminal SH3-like domain-containing protein [Terriglobales bacterium]|nr:myosin N-terminal SH3-like domain-containing protein [Terriglobales bacterium]